MIENWLKIEHYDRGDYNIEGSSFQKGSQFCLSFRVGNWSIIYFLE